MPPTSNSIDCPVDFHKSVNEFGAFANAFRLLQETGAECFLDFCVYSAQSGRAQVIARIRIHQSFIPVIHSRLTEVLLNITGTPGVEMGEGLVMKDGLPHTPEGKLILLPGISEDDDEES